ncbi:MAG: hypothetical protein RMJ67_01265 [Elusimicrobiota bacterium]|nr:hypothetical protein [Endomicrobiia bacterium]MDW8165133.1 hypothetical protein [Elusimicrobiota bacterium]
MDIRKLKIGYTVEEKEKYRNATLTYNVSIPMGSEQIFTTRSIEAIPFSYIIQILFRNHTSYNLRFRIIIGTTTINTITITPAMDVYIITARDGFLSYTTGTGITRINFLPDNFSINTVPLASVFMSFSIVNNSTTTPLNIGIRVIENQFIAKEEIVRPFPNLS